MISVCVCVWLTLNCIMGESVRNMCGFRRKMFVCYMLVCMCVCVSVCYTTRKRERQKCVQQIWAKQKDSVVCDCLCVRDRESFLCASVSM